MRYVATNSHGESHVKHSRWVRLRTSCKRRQHATKDRVLGSDGSRDDRAAARRLRLSDRRPEAVENFRHVGYPQQLRVLLGIGKLAGAIVLLLPRLPTLKEWAYAGFTFMWIAASVAHYLAGDGALFLLPIALIGSLAVSYVTRPANRRGSAKAMPPVGASRDQRSRETTS